MASICKEDDCGRIVNGHGMCKSHYMHWYRAEKKKNGGRDFTTYHQKVAAEPGGRLPRRSDWSKEDLEAFWIWTKKELKLA